MQTVGRCHLGFGEILQGIYDNDPFLFNFPISSYSYASVETLKESCNLEIKAGNPNMNIEKSIKSAKLFCELFEIKGSYKLSIHRNIPSGLGMSTSSADIIATLRAFQKLCKIKLLSTKDIDVFFRKIEPNDGLHYAGISSYNHLSANHMSSHPLMNEDFTILGLHNEIENMTKVDTIDFNSYDIYAKAKKYSTRYKYLSTELRNALETRNFELVFYIATQSAELWQSVSPKKSFEKAINFITATNGLGIINTHSGSLLGLVYKSESIHRLNIIDAFIQSFNVMPMVFENLKDGAKLNATICG